jgi:hypothetical protein
MSAIEWLESDSYYYFLTALLKGIGSSHGAEKITPSMP